MAGFRIEGNTSGNVAEVNTENALKVALSNTPSFIGGVRLFSENDAGDATGTAYLASPETSSNYRLRVGVDSLWDDENFNYAVQNYNKHKYTSATMTAVWGGGFITTNSGSSTAAAVGCQLQTYKPFPLQGQGGLYVENIIAFSNTPVANTVFDIGAFIPGATATVIPLDGVYFRVNSSGFYGVININGAEALTGVFDFTPEINRFYKFNITLTDSEVEYWIDDVLYATKLRAIAAGGNMLSGSAPWAFRHHNTGVTSGIFQVKIASYAVASADVDNMRLWSVQKAGQGLSGVQYAGGAAAGQTTNGVNSTVPATGVLSNTAASYATLGGKFTFAAVAGAETDYALFAFLVPAMTPALTGRSLMIRGIWIDLANMVVPVATTATLFEWTLAVGSTAANLAAVDAAATRLPKRIPLGIQSLPIGATVGQLANRIDVNLDAPLTVEPNTYLHVILRMPLGTATATEMFRGQIGINSYWE